MLWLLLTSSGVGIVGRAAAKAYDGERVLIDTSEGERSLAATGVVECVGYVSNDFLYEECRYGSLAVRKIGAARTIANITNAIWDAYELGSSL